MTRPIKLEHMQDCLEWWGGATRKGRKESDVAWKVNAKDIKARGYNLDIKNPHAPEDNHGDPDEWLAKLDASELQAVKLRDELKDILAEALQR